MDPKVENPYRAPTPSIEAATRVANVPARNYRRMGAACIVGMIAGLFCAAVFTASWNNPIHWANLIAFAVVFPTYLLVCLRLGYGLQSVKILSCLVIISWTVVFNSTGYAMRAPYGGNNITTPIGCLVVWLAVLSVVQLLQWLIRRKVAG
jgi:hypothetical protein